MRKKKEYGMAAKHKEIIFFKALLAPFQSIQGLNYQAIYRFL